MQRPTAMSNGAPTLLATRVRDERDEEMRAPQLAFDPLFAATLVNQITPGEPVYGPSYPAPKGVRAGIAFDLKA